MRCRRFLRALPCTVLVTATMACVPASASEVTPDASGLEGSGPLDGLAFRGRLGPADAPPDDRVRDALYFRNGHFWSEQCTECGFEPGRYWVRYSSEGIHFRGRLQNDDGGVFHYRGLVRDDGDIEATIAWHKERWYWTINREFRFDGTQREATASFDTLDRARTTAIAALQSGATCEPGQ